MCERLPGKQIFPQQGIYGKRLLQAWRILGRDIRNGAENTVPLRKIQLEALRTEKKLVCNIFAETGAFTVILGDGGWICYRAACAERLETLLLVKGS